MEKQIEEIIDSCYDEETTIDKNGNIEGGKLTLNKEKLIKAISELFKGMYPKEFIWWMNRNLNQYKYEWEKSEVFIYGKWRTLPNLYQYWIENIKDK